MSNRETFLERVREAVRKGGHVGNTPPLPDRKEVGYQGRRQSDCTIPQEMHCKPPAVNSARPSMPKTPWQRFSNISSD